MNWNLVGTVALKVGVALLSGIAVFVSVDKAMNRKSNDNNVNLGMDPGVNSNPGPNKADAVVSSLRATQDTCSKIFNVAKDLGAIVESTRRLFGKDDGNYYSQQYNGNWGYAPIESRGQSWTRISPFIIEAGSGPYNPANNNNYPF